MMRFLPAVMHAFFCIALLRRASALPSEASIFHRHLSKEVLLQLFNIAERELRIFIYPIPDHVERYTDENPSEWQECTGRTHELHFCIEELFVRYLRDVRDNFEAYPHLKTNFVTHSADHANTFIIDHTWVMKTSAEKHLRPIINNVVDNYPYYNRSYGHDHFLVYPYDFGVLCSGRHRREDWSEIDDCHVDETVGHKYFCHVSRILNTSFIGNYGMDAKYYNENEYAYGLKKCIGECPRVICHRPNIDIVTPQYLTSNTHACYTDLATNGSIYVNREYDSCFKGSYHYQRSILEAMKKNDVLHYKYNKTELFRETDDLLKCVFAYHMCGQACWSLRLYDALALGAIPIIVADGAIQAFERFLDWRTFSIKISVAELFQDRFTFRFRRSLRKQVDLFRRSIQQHSKTLNGLVQYTTPLSGESKMFSRKIKKDGFVLTKMMNVRSVVPFLNFRDLQCEVNAFRMLVLEMFCRSVRRRLTSASYHRARSFWLDEEEMDREFSALNSSALAADPRFQLYVCSRRPDFIARLRFVR